MDAKEFNELIKSHKSDKGAANKLFLYSLSIIERRLTFRNVYNDTESISHSILQKFIANLPDRYIVSPVSYLNKCTDYFLSNSKQKESRTVPLQYDLGYEQSFEKLEALDIYSYLEKHLGKEDAFLVYGRCVERTGEEQLANVLDISYTAARQRISRAKKKLKKILRTRVTKGNLD